MLRSLYIENIAVIERASIELEAGFTVLTGETGAGKSIIVDAIHMVTGQRASRDLVRTGAKTARVTAAFTEPPDSPALQLLAQEGFELPEGEDLLLERTLTAEGRSTAKINGRPAPLTLVRELGARLINIHGQHDGQHLLAEERHIGFLDRLAGVEPLLQEYRACYREAVSLRRRLSALRSDEKEKARRMDLLRFQIAEIEEAALKEGEEEQLLQRRRLMRGAQKAAEGLSMAIEALAPAEGGGVRELLSQAVRTLTPHRTLSEDFERLAARGEGLLEETVLYTETLRDALEALDFNESEAEAVEQRLSQLAKLRQKYGETVGEMLEFGRKAQKELQTIEFSDEEKKRLAERLENVYNKLQRLASELSKARKTAAFEVEKKVERELAFLDLDKTTFVVSVTPMDRGVYGEDGADQVVFLISTNPGEEPRSLSRIVSGGELSRIMLALKAILGRQDGVGTAIFDEVDAGVSGSAAEKIGKKLRELSGDRQVLCITHLAQIACLADGHLLIEKKVTEERTATTVTPLDHERRVRELARLLSGEDVTEAALTHAAELLRAAGESSRS